MALLVALVGIALGAPQQAQADEEAWTGLRDVSSLVPDLAHGHSFVSEGKGRSRIAVTDLQGALLTTISGLAGPGAMALSPEGKYVDVVLTDGHAIGRIDTTTLSLASTFPLPASAGCPHRVAESGGKIWFAFNSCDYGNPDGLATLDPATGQVQVLPKGPWLNVELLTAPSQPNLLVTVTRSSPATVSVYDTSGSAAPTVTTGVRAASYALSPDGTTLYAGTSSAIYSAPLAAPGSQTLLTSTGASALNVSPDGSRLAAWVDRGLCVLDAQSGATIRCRTKLRDFLGAPTAVVSLGGDAVAAAVGPSSPQSVYQGTSGAWLEVLDDPNRALTRLTLSTPYPKDDDSHSGQVASGTTVNIQGAFSAPDVSGMQLSVSRRGPLGADLPLMPAVPDANGAFTINDAPLTTGRYRYLVRYAGSPAQAPSTAEYDLDVQAPVTRLLLDEGSSPNTLLGDPVHHRVFVADSSAGVRAFDDQGQQAGTTSGLLGVSALVLSPDSQTLYAAVPKDDQVVALDPVTLAVITVWPTGTMRGPRRLALVNGRMVVAYRNDAEPYGRGFAAFDPSSAADTLVALSVPGGVGFDDPPLSADPAVPDGLLVVDENNRNLLLYSVGPSSLSLLAQSPGGCPNAAEVRGGHPVIRTSLSRIYCGNRELDATTLAWQRVVDLKAVAPSGDQLAGIAPFGVATSAVQLRVQRVGDDEYSVSGNPDAVGLEAIDASAWTSDSNGVLVLGDFYDTSGPAWVTRSALFRLDATPARGTTVTAAMSATSTVGAATALTGKVATTDGAPLADATLRLIARGPAGSVSLPSVVTASDGTFTTDVTPQTVGSTAYDIEYDGLLHQAPAWNHLTTEVAARTGAATLGASTTEISPGQTSTLDLKVSPTHGPSTASLTTSSTTGTTHGASVPVTNGTAEFTVTPAVDSTYSVQWSGDDWDTAATTDPLTVAVRPTTKLVDAPAALSRSTSVSVQFTRSDPGGTSTCKVDGTTKACTSPVALTGLRQGPHTLTVTTRSAAGAVGPAATAGWTVDSAPPRTAATLGLLSSTSLVARWSATDPSPSTGISRYLATVTNARGTVVASSSSSALSLTVPAAQGMSYRLSVKSVDRAGNASPVAVAGYTMPVDDRHFAFSSGWTRLSSTPDFAGSTATTRVAGKTASYTATGRRYVLWVTTCPSCGRAAVTVAGQTHTLDLYSPATRHRVAFLVYAATTSARRTMTVKATGTRQLASSGTWIKVDALQTSP